MLWDCHCLNITYYVDKTIVFSRVLCDSTPRFVRRLVGWSVGWSVGHTLLFFYVFYSLTILLLPKYSGELKYGPCPPARDWGSRVSGLVFGSLYAAVF